VRPVLRKKLDGIVPYKPAFSIILLETIFRSKKKRREEERKK